MNFHITEKKKHMIFIILLIILTVLVRLQSDHQTDFDSYWLHAQAESIQLHGSALWVFHPSSVFGYYPLSYPSGTMFILASMSSLTGLDMNTTVLMESIIAGLCVTLLVLIFTHYVSKSWIVAHLAAFILTLSPIFVSYTSFNAAGRVLILIFYIPFLLFLLKWQDTKKWSYLVISGLFFVVSLAIHRTGQLRYRRYQYGAHEKPCRLD